MVAASQLQAPAVFPLTGKGAFASTIPTVAGVHAAAGWKQKVLVQNACSVALLIREHASKKIPATPKHLTMGWKIQERSAIQGEPAGENAASSDSSSCDNPAQITGDLCGWDATFTNLGCARCSAESTFLKTCTQSSSKDSVESEWGQCSGQISAGFVGLVVGVVAVLAAVAWAAIRTCSNRNDSRSNSDRPSTVALAMVKKDMVNFNAMFTRLKELGAIRPDALERKPREIARSSVQMLQVLGEGAFGKVWKGLLEEQGSNADFDLPAYLVAIKTVKVTKAPAVDVKKHNRKLSFMQRFSITGEMMTSDGSIDGASADAIASAKAADELMPVSHPRELTGFLFSSFTLPLVNSLMGNNAPKKQKLFCTLI